MRTLSPDPATSAFTVPTPQVRRTKLERIPVTQFKDYLACPYRYYLRHVCKLRVVNDSARELDGGAFGRLLHRVLGAFARDESGPRHSDRARDIAFSDAPSDGGFVVRKPDAPGVCLTVAWPVNAAAGTCHYRFTPANGLPPQEDCLDLVFADEGVATLQIRHHGTGQLFATADALSEFLFVPVFRGRPR